MDDHIEQVFSKCPAFDQLDPRYSDAFMENLRGPGWITARRLRADIHDVDKRRAPCHQPAAVMDRRDHEQVGLVHSGDVGVVEQEYIIGSHPLIAEAL